MSNPNRRAHDADDTEDGQRIAVATILEILEIKLEVDIHGWLRWFVLSLCVIANEILKKCFGRCEIILHRLQMVSHTAKDNNNT